MLVLHFITVRSFPLYSHNHVLLLLLLLSLPIHFRHELKGRAISSVMEVCMVLFKSSVSSTLDFDYG